MRTAGVIGISLVAVGLAVTIFSIGTRLLDALYTAASDAGISNAMTRS
jgi:hypothetical protein